MLIEQLEANGISVVSANTDGVVSLLAQSDRELFNAIVSAISWYEPITVGEK
jgi:transcriptional regulator of NAD metabolism